MHIFVVEYITGGGLKGQDLESELFREAEIMVAALVTDLRDVPDVQVLVSRDHRLARLSGDCEVFVPDPDEDIWEAWARGIERCDAVWPIMPESAGTLQRISAMVLGHGRVLIGSQPEAVSLTASKHLTAKTLEASGIACVPTFFTTEAPFPPVAGPWVLKPDDGVGCEGLQLFDRRLSLYRSLRDNGARADYVAQPYIRGCAASLSTLCSAGKATLLAANIQRIATERDGLHLESIEVNAISDVHLQYARLASAVAAAIPGLWGYVGIDILISANGPVVLEVNPRLTLSYAGLRAALGINPAELVVRMIGNGDIPALALALPSAESTVNVPFAVPHVA